MGKRERERGGEACVFPIVTHATICRQPMTQSVQRYSGRIYVRTSHSGSVQLSSTTTANKQSTYPLEHTATATMHKIKEKIQEHRAKKAGEQASNLYTGHLPAPLASFVAKASS